MLGVFFVFFDASPNLTDEVLVDVRSFLFFLTPPLTLLIKLDITDEVLVDVRSFLGFFDASPNLTHCQPPVPHL